MLDSITINPSFPHWSRLFCHNENTPLCLTLSQGVNVVVAPNGRGKSTVFNAVQSLVMEGEYKGNVVMTGKPRSENRQNMMFFSVKDMLPKNMMRDINPSDNDATDQVGFWFGRQSLSHGQSTHELMVDINEICENGTTGCIFIDEPELAMDAENLIHLITMIKKHAETVQFVIVSHHPWLVLNQDFNVVELDPKAHYQQILLKQMKTLNLLSK
jgi:ABC-type cobalamin/Fe3+-siderophores transport system ATPase subunit